MSRRMNQTAERLIRRLHLPSTLSTSHTHPSIRLLPAFCLLRPWSLEPLRFYVALSVSLLKQVWLCVWEREWRRYHHRNEMRCEVTGMREGTGGCADEMTHSETALRHQPDNMVFGRYVKDSGRSFYCGEGTCCWVKDVCRFFFPNCKKPFFVHVMIIIWISSSLIIKHFLVLMVVSKCIPKDFFSLNAFCMRVICTREKFLIVDYAFNTFFLRHSKTLGTNYMWVYAWVSALVSPVLYKAQVVM